ncbi:hypothetical protein V6N11_047913 [Hibiscus sabdariffa]|uniref:Uncharacterized protein n=2 Tax=Hibiscus sabdariffa TaxID=183260 RepID=A0ABR2ANG4_9ROSI
MGRGGISATPFWQNGVIHGIEVQKWQANSMFGGLSFHKSFTLTHSIFVLFQGHVSEGEWNHGNEAVTQIFFQSNLKARVKCFQSGV